MPHSQDIIQEGTGTTDGKEIVLPQAIIVRTEEMFGSIRIRCPADNTEHEVDPKQEFFTCPIDGKKLLVRIKK